MEYLSRKSLASYHVNTPDPYLDNPPLGQQILVSWNLPQKFFIKTLPLTVKLTVRFGNNEEVKEYVNLERNWGIFSFRLINEEYFSKCGIKTYKVELISDDQVIDIWRHQLWAELIIF